MDQRTWGLVSVVILGIILNAWLTKPNCRDGFVSILSPINGWVCVPGYKP
ncbi:hypothetical protein JOE50_002492 [Bradyrhizobium japonicum]|nr:hypothetical protein [Bradyrhizobium japonicum]